MVNDGETVVLSPFEIRIIPSMDKKQHTAANQINQKSLFFQDVAHDLQRISAAFQVLYLLRAASKTHLSPGSLKSVELTSDSSDAHPSPSTTLGMGKKYT
jgi:hypothetical protein